MDAGALALCVVGFVVLVLGAEALVRGASRLSLAAGISPLVIGLTVVAYGTGSPELAVTVQATLAGSPDIAIGNVVGSNILNVLFVLGVGALIVPLKVAQQLVRLDVPLLIGASVLLLVLSLDGHIGRGDGVLLCTGAIAYTIFAIRLGRAESAAIQEEYAREFGDYNGGRVRVGRQIVWIVLGLIALTFGARWLVAGAVGTAKALGVSELIVGLTVIAIGTSMPELVTTVVASLRGERDIAVGNAIGSSLFNILGVAGVAGLLAPEGVGVAPAVLRFDMPVMLAAAVACLPIFLTDSQVARWEGALFLCYYAAYASYLVLDAMGHDAVPIFSTVMLSFVIPMTIVALTVLATRAIHAEDRHRF
jgi:cation:H+ antiporter